MRNSRWTSNLSVEQATELEKKLKGASVEDVLERLSLIFDQRMNESTKAQLSKSKYDSPNWALQQADAIGYQRAIAELQTFIKTDD